MKSPGKKEKAISFKHPVEVRVTQLPIKPFASLRNLDVEKLSRAKSAEVELGLIKSSCCERIARAIIRNGQVTAVRVDPCSEKQSTLPKEFKQVLAVARKKTAAKRKPSDRFPVPVKKFLTQSQLAIDVTKITCYRICLFGWCIDCCEHVGGGWLCGRVVIDTTTGPFNPDPN